MDERLWILGLLGNQMEILQDSARFCKCASVAIPLFLKKLLQFFAWCPDGPPINAQNHAKEQPLRLDLHCPTQVIRKNTDEGQRDQPVFFKKLLIIVMAMKNPLTFHPFHDSSQLQARYPQFQSPQIHSFPNQLCLPGIRLVSSGQPRPPLACLTPSAPRASRQCRRWRCPRRRAPI